MNAVFPMSATDEPDPVTEIHPPSDPEIVDEIVTAVNKVQEAMDRAILAGLIVEPKFKHIENRLTRSGMRLDSYVCSVRVFRKLI